MQVGRRRNADALQRGGQRVVVQRLAVDQRPVHVPVDCLRRHYAFLLQTSLLLHSGPKIDSQFCSAAGPFASVQRVPWPQNWVHHSPVGRTIAHPIRQLRKRPFPAKVPRAPGSGMRKHERSTGKSEARRRGARRLALLRRRQHAGSDSGEARHFQADGAAAGFACGVGRADPGQGRPPDRQLPGTRSEAALAFRAGSRRSGAKRSGLVVDHDRHCRGRGCRDRAPAALGKAYRHGDRHRPHAEGRDRATAADGLPAAQDRFA